MYNPNDQRYYWSCCRPKEDAVFDCHCPTGSECPACKTFDEEFLMFAITLNEKIPLGTTISKMLS